MKNNENQTPYMQSLKTRILETAMKEFVEKGMCCDIAIHEKYLIKKNMMKFGYIEV